MSYMPIRRKARRFAAVLAVLLIAVLIYYGLTRPVSGVKETGDPLSAAFRATGAGLTEVRMIGWSLYSESFMEMPELKKETLLVAEKLPLGELTERAEDEADWRSYAVEGVSGGCKYQILLQTLPGQTYLLISCSDKGVSGEFSLLRAGIWSLISAGENAGLNCLMIGSLEGKLSGDEMLERAEAAFSASGAKQVEKAGDNGFLSVSGYIAALEDFVMSGGKKINIQLAYDYNERNGKTYVYMGYPLIFDDY